jgi:DNA repair protein RecO (recombination protein O)
VQRWLWPVTPTPNLYDGYVLHGRKYRETSALLELITKEHGRVGAVARGVRRKNQSGPQPFQPYLLGWRGRGELVTLTSWDAAERPMRLQGTALVSALYVNELLVKLLQRQDPYPEVYDAYVAVLPQLGAVETRESSLRIFEKRLVSALGYGLELGVGERMGLDPAVRYRYRPDAGLEPAQPGTDDNWTVSGATLLALESESFSTPAELLEAKRLMRVVIEDRLEGRRLVSRSLLRG